MSITANLTEYKNNYHHNLSLIPVGIEVYKYIIPVPPNSCIYATPSGSVPTSLLRYKSLAFLSILHIIFLVLRFLFFPCALALHIFLTHLFWFIQAILIFLLLWLCLILVLLLIGLMYHF